MPSVEPAVGETTSRLADAVDKGTVSSCTFPRSSRLLTAADYAQVFKKNERFSDRYWTVLCYSGDDSDAKLGLAIAKKRAKRATDRNRLKRIVRESFRCHRLRLEGRQVVVMNRDLATTESAAVLRSSIDAILLKIITRQPRS